MGLRLKIANDYGNVDVREKLSKAYVHVGGQRLQPLCRKLGIKYAQALVGFSERGRKARFGYQPEFDGVVVSARSAQKLRRAIEERVKRAAERPQKSPQQRAAERNRRQHREADSFAAAIESQFPNCPEDEAYEIACHACEVGSGRVGRTATLSLEEKVHLAVVAHIRHRHTAYEQLLDDFGDDEDRRYARHCVSGQIDAILEKWQGDSEQAVAPSQPSTANHEVPHE